MAVSNALNWFEIPTTDFQRGVKFYNTILDTEMHVESMGELPMAFFPATPAEKGTVGGAVIFHPESKPSADGTMVYLNGGNDLSPILDRVESAGGKVIMPKTQITPEIGYMAMFIDSEGNRVGLHSEN